MGIIGFVHHPHRLLQLYQPLHGRVPPSVQRKWGLRKVVGAFKMQLISQYLSESVLISFFALVLGTGLAVHQPVLAQHVHRKSAFAEPYYQLAFVDRADRLRILW